MINFRAWLELGRVSNLPTVWSNVLHGMGVAFFVAIVLPVQEQYPDAPPIDWPDLGMLLNHGFMLMVGMSLLYLGGMMLNDVCDVKTDAQERPSRPLPSGRVSRRSAVVGAAVMLLLGWACTLVYRPEVSIWAGALVCLIVGYNLMHSYRIAGLVLMPLCRGLLVWVSASAIGAGKGVDADMLQVLGSVAAVMCYTMIITLIAWGEALPSMRKVAPWIGVLIAGLALLDAGFMLQMDMWPMAVFCAGCGVLSLIGQRWIRGS